MTVPADVGAKLHKLMPVSRETLERLDHLVQGIAKWSPQINLVADSRPETVWSRHVLDCAQLFRYCDPTARHWCDLGAGGGFPGLVVACLAAEKAPGMRFALIESDRRKAAFLLLTARELGLACRVLPERIEAAERQGADIVSARALAPLSRLLGLVERHLAPRGVALLQKGQRSIEEIIAAQRDWAFTVESFDSIVDGESRILRVTDLRSVDAN
ncbi:16S rRNA (guanine(527)-N(7))-methyltransferase RsmG [Pararhodobacter sp. SW119]|uniref:16S rRNA (guanine(527)-N(7))-methyltransferase RsmG n=1 Tax=Pararhodobacter sp. SW119 TaxID=2780075 RepID=UPI001AE0E385|nr:16S rRNA (guanine(527)-N(7))-methyltransferase RsmG [Pararhodobacter sp. SW119]